jgi:hypothetical protein
MTKRKSEADRKNDARAMKEWAKTLGHKPTPEDMQRALIGAAPAQRKHEKKEFESGKKAGYAWAESGRSIAAVEAVVKFATRPSQCAAAEVVTKEMIEADGQLDADLMDKMTEEIRDDEEFEALQDKDDAYIDGWYAGVIAGHGEM